MAKKDKYPYKISNREVGSPRDSKTFLENAASLLNWNCFLRSFQLSIEVQQVSIGLQSYSSSNFKDDSVVRDVNLGCLLTMGSGMSGIFFQILAIDSLQIFSPLSYRDLQYLFRKI